MFLKMLFVYFASDTSLILDMFSVANNVSNIIL